MSITHIAHMRR